MSKFDKHILLGVIFEIIEAAQMRSMGQKLGRIFMYFFTILKFVV